jgi:hypothetical protein
MFDFATITEYQFEITTYCNAASPQYRRCLGLRVGELCTQDQTQ